jgi:hypothetical protein
LDIRRYRRGKGWDVRWDFDKEDMFWEEDDSHYAEMI